MASARTAASRRTAIATALSVAGHAAIVILIALDLDRGETEPIAPPIVELNLAPLRRKPEPPPTRQPPASPPRAPRQTAAAVLSALPAPPAPGPVSPAPAPSPTTRAPQDLPTALRTGCVGKRGLQLEQRVDCKLEIWSVLDGRPPRELPGDTIPDDKQAKWDLVAARQARQRRGPAKLGNGASMGCPHANLGTGCLDDMLIPMIGSEAREARSGSAGSSTDGSGFPRH